MPRPRAAQPGQRLPSAGGGVHLPAGEGTVMATYASAQALLAG